MNPNDLQASWFFDPQRSADNMISWFHLVGGGGGGERSWIWLIDNIITEISALLLKEDYRLNVIVWFHESSGIF